MAVSQVLDTVELLEMIILELPIRDVFLKQRVSRHWHSTITDSAQLQQALFLKPSAPCNPDDPMHLTTFTLDDSCANVLATPGRKTVFQSVLAIAESGLADDRDGPPVKIGILEGFQAIHVASAMGYRKASWRGMLLCQPPMDRVAFLVNHQNVPIQESFTLCESTDLTEVKTLAGGRIRRGELDRHLAVLMEGCPHVDLLALSQAISTQLQSFEFAHYKGDSLHMAMGGDGELELARTVFETSLRHSWFWESSRSTFLR